LSKEGFALIESIKVFSSPLAVFSGQFFLLKIGVTRYALWKFNNDADAGSSFRPISIYQKIPIKLSLQKIQGC